MLKRPLGSLLVAGAALLTLISCGGGSSDTAAPYYLANGVALADLDGDTLLDPLVAMAEYGYGPPHAGYVNVRFQQASPAGSFEDPYRLISGADPYALALGDLNGDNRPDLVIANTQTVPGAILSNTLTVRLSAPTPGTFQAPLTLALGTRDPLDVAVGDLNHDTLLDIAVASRGANNVQVFFATAPGVFAAPVTVPVSAEPTALTLANLNGDAYLDLAVTTAANTVEVCLQNSGAPGTFAAAVAYPVGTSPVAVKAADLNGDGRLDLAVANWGSPTSGLSLLMQSGTTAGTFLATTNLDTGDAYASSVALADLNADGRVDLVVTNAGASGQPGSVAVFLQSATTAGSFPAPTLYQGYFGPMSVAIGDLNGDGRPDLLLSDGTPSVRFQSATPPGTFQPPVWLRY